MSDEKRTINTDGLKDAHVDAFQEAVDAVKEGRGMWLVDEDTYGERLNQAFDIGFISSCTSIAIASGLAAIFMANKDKIAAGLSNAAKFIFGKKK